MAFAVFVKYPCKHGYFPHYSRKFISVFDFQGTSADIIARLTVLPVIKLLSLLNPLITAKSS